MKKSSRMITLAIAAAVMMAATACGSKNKPKEPASSEAATEAVTTTEAAATTGEIDSEAQSEDQAGGNDEAAEEETTAQASGEIGSNNIFKAASGKFEIKVPNGWVIDDGSDDEYVTFFSANGEDMLEIMNISGQAIDSDREVYPDTADEYKDMVSREDGIEILSYDVKNKEDGSQTFQYSMKYGSPVDGIRFLAKSGYYNAANQSYVCAAGTVKSTDEAVVNQVDEAVKSFQFGQ